MKNEEKGNNSFLTIVGAIVVALIIIYIAGNSSSETTYTPETQKNTNISSTFYTQSTANIRKCPSISCDIWGTYDANTDLILSYATVNDLPEWIELPIKDSDGLIQIGYINRTTLGSNKVNESSQIIYKTIQNTTPQNVNIQNANSSLQTNKKSTREIINEWRSNTALVACGFAYVDYLGNPSKTIMWGSGFLRADPDGLIRVYTNKHVITDAAGVSAYYGCEVKIPGDSTIYTINSEQFRVSSYGYDWGILPITAATDFTKQTAHNAPLICSSLAQSGDDVLILGYPDYSGTFLEPTVTPGIISSLAGDYYNTSAKIESGNSGGVAVDINNDCYLGIPSAVQVGNYESMGKILRADLIFTFK